MKYTNTIRIGSLLVLLFMAFAHPYLSLEHTWMIIPSFIPPFTSESTLVLEIYALTVFLWCFTHMDETYVALLAATILVLTRSVTTQEFFDTLGDSTVWLLIASCIVSHAMVVTGLSERLILAVARRSCTVRQLFFRLTLALFGAALFIPSTTGRAAFSIPLFESFTLSFNQHRITRALALLFPTIIEFSAISSLLGAAAHLVSIDILVKMGFPTITFLQWLIWGLPLAIVTCVIANIVILHLFLTKEERNQIFEPSTHLPVKKPLSSQEKFVLAVVSVMVILWILSPFHGLDLTLISVLGSVLLTAPKIGVMSLNEGLKSVHWALALFLAATLTLGTALTESGAAEQLTHYFFDPLHNGQSSFFIVMMVALLSVISHLMITSRIVRCMVLTPLVITLAIALNFNPTSFVFLSTAGAGFCLTLAACAKSVAMFSRLGYDNRDLLKMSTVLTPIYVGVLMVFAFFVWPLLGLSLH